MISEKDCIWNKMYSLEIKPELLQKLEIKIISLADARSF
ncbi:hypothetical protein MSIBF_A930006 [groundwater metagenome]|uniref:Uncharacterized protein n=1 Tax=groundwater metagenome TaxID=717931 RepID=A0A098EEU5_9ZZZZ